MAIFPKREGGKRVIPTVSTVLILFLFSCSLFGQGRRVLVDHKTGRGVKYSSEKGDKRIVTIPHNFVRKKGEMRGAWVATAWNQDFPVCRSAAEFQNSFRRLLASLKRAGINTVIFQIRPQCDAFYISKINPWSAFLSGGEGIGFPGFDPLLFMVRESHRQGFRFHAWLNPYRVRGYAPEGKEAALKKLSPLSFARRFPDAVLAVRNGKLTGLMLDPGHPRTTEHLLETVREILHKYDVDAIHFDDYFYPYSDMKNADMRTYEKYCRNRKIPLQTWRRNNVDSLICSVGTLVRKHNKLNRKRVEFGVSPFGVWRNRKDDPAGSPTKGLDSYGILFADSRRWVRENYVDYIAPQIYWSFSEPSAPFACVMDWWASQVKGTRVKLYAGLTLHKYGQKKPFWEAPDELKNQLLYSAALPQTGGFILFSAGRILHASESALLKKNLSSALPLWGGTLP
ncbi:MAG: family 10 glycosylhydrolase [Lentisphaeria bacterium]|nr:family 10 glycosylhydrolase [Lentisphaeria bacterium]